MHQNQSQCGKLKAAGKLVNQNVTSPHSTLHTECHPDAEYTAIQWTTTHPDRLAADYNSGTVKDILNTGNELPGGAWQQYPNINMAKYPQICWLQKKFKSIIMLKMTVNLYFY